MPESLPCSKMCEGRFGSTKKADPYGVLEGFYYYGDQVEVKNVEVEGYVVPTQSASHMNIRAVNPSMLTCMHRACIVLFLIATHETLCSNVSTIRCLITADGCSATSEQAIKMV